ncbi:MAG: DUF3560 domain-containing protein [Solirubrobacterales bacterium]
MTYRERREARAERLRGWAATRQARAAAVFKAGEPFTSDIAFNTQPGHIPFRARLIAREERAYESVQKAASMESRADGIEAQLTGAIYSDDPDAIEALRARLEALEAQREQIKTRNAAYRKEHGAELKGLSVYEREQKMPHAGWELSNLTGNISRNRERLAHLERVAAAKADAPDRVTVAPAPTMPGHLQVRFPEAPAYEVRQELKASGYFWHAGTQAWYGPADRLPSALQEATA